MSGQDSGELTDILETLENLEQSVMQYEDSLNEGDEDSSIIHIIFRYAHNLKSALAMAHKEYSSELIHAVESEFDLIRSGKAAANTEVIDKTFASIDLIKENLYQETEDEEALKALQEQVEELQETTKDEGLAGIRFPLTAEAEKLLKEAEDKKYTVYQIEKLINSDIDPESLAALPIYEDIKEIGFHIITYPPFDQIDKNAEEAVLKILFASEKGADELFYDIFDPFREVDIQNRTGGAAPEKVSSTKTTTVETRSPASTEKQKAVSSDKKPGEFTILIVEDDFTTRHLEESIMREFGECEVAVSGDEAVRAFESRLINNEPYDLILLDILIPNMDGHAVLERIRDFEEEKGIRGFDRTKVVVVSNLKDMENITKSFRGQSDSYIVKPVTKNKITRELKRLKLLA